MTEPIDTIDQTGGIDYLLIATPGQDVRFTAGSNVVSAQVYQANIRGDGPISDAIGSAVVAGNELVVPGAITAGQSLKMLFVLVQYSTGGRMKVIIDVH